MSSFPGCSRRIFSHPPKFSSPPGQLARKSAKKDAPETSIWTWRPVCFLKRFSIPESKHRYQKLSIFKRNHLFQTVFLGCPCSSHLYQWDEEVTKWTINAFLNFLCWLSSYIAMLAVSLWNFLRFENMDTFQAVTSQRTAWLFPPLKQCIVLCTCMAPFFSLGRAAFVWTWNESFL